MVRWTQRCCYSLPKQIPDRGENGELCFHLSMRLMYVNPYDSSGLECIVAGLTFRGCCLGVFGRDAWKEEATGCWVEIQRDRHELLTVKDIGHGWDPCGTRSLFAVAGMRLYGYPLLIEGDLLVRLSWCGSIRRSGNWGSDSIGCSRLRLCSNCWWLSIGCWTTANEVLPEAFLTS